MIQADWHVAPGIRALVTTKESGNLATHVGDPVEARQNRAKLAKTLLLPREPVWMEQPHGDHVHIAPGDTPAVPRADAAYTVQMDLPLVVLVADCLPVFLASDAGEIAVVHAGWRGIAANIIGKTVACFSTGAISSGAISAWLGPCVGPCHYEVDAFVRDAFESGTGFAPGDDLEHWRMSLTAIAVEQLRAAGVGLISGGGFCTVCDSRFYSHRENGALARMAAIIWREAC